MVATRRICSVVILAIGIWFVAAEMLKPESAGGEASSGQVSDGKVVDVNGNTYATVKIGSQTWMAENLRATSYHDGSQIEHVENDEKWSSLSSGGCCAPAVDSSLKTGGYGLLYNFFAVSDSRGLCPEGWHVPAASEWRVLIDFLGGVEVAGAKMKSTSAGAWRQQVEGTNNESGFSAVPAGGRGRFGGAGEAGNYATWWSSTPDDPMYAWHWGLHPDKNSIRSNPGHVQSGFSVRCVKDQL